MANTHVETLQRVQNSALRIATGYTKSTSIAHPHAETKVLPVKDHLNMRGTQFYATAADPQHPYNYLHHAPPTPRDIHRTLTVHYSSLYSQIPPIPTRRTEKLWIHDQFVSEYLSQAPVNSILGEPPPLISNSESFLPRESRVHLARLRFENHPLLLTYQNMRDQITNLVCWYCGTGVENITHLLENCPPLSALRGTYGVLPSSGVPG